MARVLPFSDKIQPVLYWLLLLGWLVAKLDLEELKLWLTLTDPLIRRFGYNLDAVINKDLPSIPQWAQSIGYFSAVTCGSILIFNLAASFFTRKK